MIIAILVSLMLTFGFVGCDDDLPSDPNKAILGKWMDLGTSVSPYTSKGDIMEFYKHGRMSVKRKDGVVIDYTYYIRETTPEDHKSTPYILHLRDLSDQYGLFNDDDNTLEFKGKRMIITKFEPVGYVGAKRTELIKK